ncbi:MAG: DUF748 domain-containing protein [Thermoanaerobaculia bacterium]
MHSPRRVLDRVSRRSVAAVAVAFLVYVLAGFLVVPRVVVAKLPPALSAKLHRPVTLAGAKANPFTLSLTLEGLRVGEREGPGTFVSVGRAFVNAQLSSIVHRGVVLAEVVVEDPVVSIARTGERTLSISDLVEELTKEEPGSRPARFAVANIRVERGSILFDDRPAGTKHVVSGLRVGIPFLSNLPVDQEVFTEPYLGAKVNGSAFELKGRTRPFSGTREASLDVDFEDVDLPFYFAYVPVRGTARLSSGRLDTKMTLSFRQEKGKPPAVLLAGRASLREIRLDDAGKAPLVAWKRLDAVLASADVFRKDVRLASLAAEEPEVWLYRDRAGGYPILEKFLGKAPAAAAAGAAAEAGAAWSVGIASTVLRGGRVHWRDEHPRRVFEAVLREVSVDVGGLSTARGKAATLKASTVSDAGETLRLDGTFTLEPQASEGSLSLTAIPLKRYAPYYEDALFFGLGSGSVDLSTRYRWPAAGGSTALSDLAVTLKDLRARKEGEKEDFLRVPSASMTGASIDPEKQEVRIAALGATGAFLKVLRQKDGSVDLARLVKEEPAGAPGGTDGAGSGGWTTRLASLALEKGSVRFVDESAPRPVTLVVAPISFSGEGLSTARGEKGKVRARAVLNGKGSVSTAGSVGLAPVSAQLKVDVAGVQLPPFAGYLPERVRLSLESGAIEAKGTVSAREGPDGSYSFGWEGEATCGDLRLVDPATSEDFLAWDSLRFGGMKATSSPPSFVAEKMSLTDFFARIELYEDGTLNYRKAFGLAEPPPVDDAAAEAAASGAGAAGSPPPAAPAPGPAALPAPAAGAPYVRIDAVTLSGGRLHVDDRFVKPNYRADMKDVGGRISGLSSEAGARAEVELRGSLEGSAPLEILGTFNPFAATSFADIRVSFRGIDLVPMTPYFVRYAGYAVEKGLLTMNVAYKLNERRLEAQNSFVVDQFTFGEKVESPTATKLPVKLAVSLLKDPDGVIRLDVPISGSVDDPKFRVGPIVWKIVGNVLLKAIRSPFALLGSLFGGGQELSFVDFAPGSSTLDAGATKRLDALATALGKRPALKLDVEGKADAAKDAEGLRRLLYERKVKARKAEALAKAGTPADSVDDVQVSPEEWPKYIEKAYRAEKFPKPRTALGFVKEIPPEEMEKLMLVNLPVGEDDLRQLALARASAVKEYLLGAGKVAPDRVFLVDPGPAGAPKPGEALTRAAFVLK